MTILLFYPRLALHLRIEEPFDDSWVVHSPANQLKANVAEKVFKDFLLTFHLRKHLAVGLAERLVLHNGLLGMKGRLKGVVESFACQLVGKATGITDEDDVIVGRLGSVQGNVGTTQTSFRNLELMECLAELLGMALEIVVGVFGYEAVDITSDAGELIERARSIVVREVDEDVVGLLAFVKLFQEQRIGFAVAHQLASDKAMSSVGTNQIATGYPGARLHRDEDAPVGLHVETGEILLLECSAVLDVVLQQGVVKVLATCHANLECRIELHDGVIFKLETHAVDGTVIILDAGQQLVEEAPSLYRKTAATNLVAWEGGTINYQTVNARL